MLCLLWGLYVCMLYSMLALGTVCLYGMVWYHMLSKATDSVYATAEEAKLSCTIIVDCGV